MRGRPTRAAIGYGNDVFGLQHKYHVIRLADLEGAAFLDAASVGPITVHAFNEAAYGHEYGSMVAKMC